MSIKIEQINVSLVADGITALPTVREKESKMLKCPKCGSTNWRCWDERTLTWWSHETGEMAGIQVIGCMACNDCNTAWADRDPEDEAFTDASPDDEDTRSVYTTGWGS